MLYLANKVIKEAIMNIKNLREKMIKVSEQIDNFKRKKVHERTSWTIKRQQEEILRVMELFYVMMGR